mmetsp:Transcript_32825/g.77818  ORF Transcript_32825/g.77818 Transcript_32825/m.77818 type:complete len:206 (-) Transcript_32825:827-1444(-)
MFSVAFRSSSLSFGTRKYRDISAVDVVQIFKSVAGFDWMTRKSDVIRRVSNLRDELHRSLRTHRDLKSKKSEKDFIDKTRIKAAAGAGGRGAFSFVPVRRIPDGGDGGPGGSVLLRATSDVRSLAGIAFLQRASDGINGGSQRRQGRSGSPRYSRTCRARGMRWLLPEEATAAWATPALPLGASGALHKAWHAPRAQRANREPWY